MLRSKKNKTDHETFSETSSSAVHKPTTVPGTVEAISATKQATTKTSITEDDQEAYKKYEKAVNSNTKLSTTEKKLML